MEYHLTSDQTLFTQSSDDSDSEQEEKEVTQTICELIERRIMFEDMKIEGTKFYNGTLIDDHLDYIEQELTYCGWYD